MQLATIQDNQIIQVGYYKDLFPNVSFPSTGVDVEFMLENSCLEVSVFKPHDKITQKLIICEPYIEGNYVYTVQVVDKTQEELDADIASLLAKKNAQTVSMRQARLALSRQGLLSTVNSAIDNMPNQEGEEARIAWEYATEVKRGDTLTQSLAQVFGWTAVQLDELFSLASTL